MSVPVRVRPPAPLIITVSTDLTSKSLPMIYATKNFPFVAVLLSLMLGGCSTPGSGEGASRLFVAPDKFQNYSCQQLEIRVKAVVTRRSQLGQLMAKAGTTPDGRLVSLLAYQSEYTETAGDLDELRRTAAAKNCKPIAVLQAPNSGR